MCYVSYMKTWRVRNSMVFVFDKNMITSSGTNNVRYHVRFQQTCATKYTRFDCSALCQVVVKTLMCLRFGLYNPMGKWKGPRGRFTELEISFSWGESMTCSPKHNCYFPITTLKLTNHVLWIHTTLGHIMLNCMPSNTECNKITFSIVLCCVDWWRKYEYIYDLDCMFLSEGNAKMHMKVARNSKLFSFGVSTYSQTRKPRDNVHVVWINKTFVCAFEMCDSQRRFRFPHLPWSPGRRYETIGKVKSTQGSWHFIKLHTQFNNKTHATRVAWEVLTVHSIDMLKYCSVRPGRQAPHGFFSR